MPGREKNLAQVLKRVAPQADEVYVYLNDMSVVPVECSEVPSNVHFFTGPDLGDRGKFMFVENFTGYYITIDDDILYPRYYISNLIAGIERYHRRAIVGWHGSVIEDDIERYYRSKSRKILSFSKFLEKDTAVHILGTGTTGLHTDTIRVRPRDFPYANMADVFLAIAAKRYGVEMVVLAHEAGEAIPLDTIDSISTVSLGDQRSSRSNRLDRSATVTRIVREHVPWPDLEEFVSAPIDPFRVSVIDLAGAIEPSDKSDAFNSIELIRRLLLAQNCIVEHSTPDEEPFRDSNLAIIRPSYLDNELEQLQNQLDRYASMGVPILIVLPTVETNKTTFLLRQLAARNREFGAVHVGFIQPLPAGASSNCHYDIDPTVIELRKPILDGFISNVEYGVSNGLLLSGLPDELTHSPYQNDVAVFFHSVKTALPEARLIGDGSHVSPATYPEVGEVWAEPIPQENRTPPRLLIHLPGSQTLPEHVARQAVCGIPVLFPADDLSLADTLKLSGVPYRSRAELTQTAQLLYRNPALWRQLSQASYDKARAQDFNIVSAHFYLSVRKFTAAAI